MTEQETYEKYARDYAEAASEWSNALLDEIAKGSETDADLRRLMAETRIPAHIRSDLFRAEENFGAARAALSARSVVAHERLADVREKEISWMRDH